MNDDIEETLRKAIADSGYGIRELARLSGMDSGQLARFIHRKRTITLPVFSRLCGVLGLILQKSEK